MIETIKSSLPAIHREGYIFIAIFAIITIILFYFSELLGAFGIIMTIWCVCFFRNPARVTPPEPNKIVSPADGIVQKIAKARPPIELDLSDKELTRVSIFLSVFDVHVNRVPVAGKVGAIYYHSGKFFNASLDKSSELNERNSVVIQAGKGVNIIVVQIAGLIARRIVCNLDKDQKVAAGEELGIIRFGSRVDLYLPDGVQPLVLEGQKMVGGETVIAQLKSK